MTTVMIDPELAAELNSNGDEVALADRDGRAIGYFVPLDVAETERQAVLASVLKRVTDEHTRHALSDPRQYDLPALRDVLRGLGGN